MLPDAIWNAKIRDIEAGDLYALLSVCTKEELDPLVKIITEKWSNSLESHEYYKRFSPCHTAYDKLIGDEIRLFGGNSVRNVFRGEGPSYDEIVIDVCKKLDIPFESGKTAKNESNLLVIFLDRQWKSLNRKEQEKILDEARKQNLTKDLTRLSLFLPILSTPRGLMTLLALPFGFSEPAFRVTVPCVLYIAYLRKKYLDEMKHSSVPTFAPSGSIGISSSVPAIIRTTSLVVYSSENEPVLSLARIPTTMLQGWYPVDNSDEGISRLNPLLQAVPSLAVASEAATTQYMEVVINGSLLKAKGTEGYRLITMIDGKPSHGTLLEPSRLSNIVNATALLQVASVVVAQKHLADISEKLSEIKACVDRIHQFQKNERRSILTGSIRYFEQVAQSVLNGEFADSIRNQIERHEADLLRVQDHLVEDIRYESQEVININDNDVFGSKGLADAIKKHQNLLSDLYQQLLLCVRARACGWQLLAAFPGEERLKDKRKDSIQELLNSLTESGDLIQQTDTLMRKKIKELSSIWNRNVIINERKLSLLEWNDILLRDVTSGKEQITRDVRSVEALISERQQPVTMIVKVEGNQIIATRAVVENKIT